MSITDAKNYLLACIIVCAMGESAPGAAQSAANPLSGVSKVTAFVSLVATETSLGSLTEGRLRTLTELRLRTAGLRVLSTAEDQQDPDINPIVDVTVSMLPATTRGGAKLGQVFSTRVAAREYQRSPRNGAIVPMELWGNAYLNIAETDRATAEVERVVGILLDEFVNAWLKANPKK